MKTSINTNRSSTNDVNPNLHPDRQGEEMAPPWIATSQMSHHMDPTWIGIAEIRKAQGKGSQPTARDRVKERKGKRTTKETRKIESAKFGKYQTSNKFYQIVRWKIGSSDGFHRITRQRTIRLCGNHVFEKRSDRQLQISSDVRRRYRTFFGSHQIIRSTRTARSDRQTQRKKIQQFFYFSLILNLCQFIYFYENNVYKLSARPSL